MIPAGGISNVPIQAVQQPSYTWRLDFERGRVSGMTDQLEALRQTVYMILQTERFRYLIYSGNYGNEIGSLVGHSAAYVRMEMTRMINEALTQDDRIVKIDNMEVDLVGDHAVASFTVVTSHGSLNFTQEVR